MVKISIEEKNYGLGFWYINIEGRILQMTDGKNRWYKKYKKNQTIESLKEQFNKRFYPKNGKVGKLSD